jgi:hypothetical protein
VCLIKFHNVTHEELETEFRLSLTSVIDGDGRSVSHTNRFTPGERTPDTHLTGSWMCLKAGLDTMEGRKICCPAANQTPILRFSVDSLVTVINYLLRLHFFKIHFNIILSPVRTSLKLSLSFRFSDYNSVPISFS